MKKNGFPIQKAFITDHNVVEDKTLALGGGLLKPPNLEHYKAVYSPDGPF